MISLVLMILAGICNAIMDVLQFKFRISIFRCNRVQPWANPEISAVNKWKYDKDGICIGEKFFGSSTFLVWLTDFWHLAKFLMLLFISASIIFYQPLINWYVDIFLMYCAFTITFELFFSKILIS